MITPEQRIRDAQRIEQFLKDEVISAALTRMERRFYEEFVASTTSEERVRSWAKANVMKEWEREMKAALEDGKLATKELERASRKPKEQ
jgi:hypothetical protein